VSFAAPLFLLALLAVPLIVVAYVGFERRRRTGERAFATPETMPSVAPSRPGWHRHAPMAAYAVAITGLALALARPEATVAVPDGQAAVMLTTDRSVSMSARDVSPTRLEAARRAADSFLDEVPEDARVGSVVYNDRVRDVETPSTDRARVREALEGLQARGGTATGDALAASMAALEPARGRSGERPGPAAIVLLSDGYSTLGRDPLVVAREARRQGIRVHTVALGTDRGEIERRTRTGTVNRRVPPDRESLRRIADASGGRAFATADELQLDAVYEELGEQLGTREERREVTAGFAGLAAVMLVAGGLMSLRWFGRLP